MKENPDQLALAAEVARLRVEAKLSIEEIAEKLSVAKGTVSNLLALARQRGIYCQVVLPPPDRLIPLRNELLGRFSHLRDVELIPGRPEILDPGFPGDNPVHLSMKRAIYYLTVRKAAEYIDRHLPKNAVVCLAWGETVETLTRFMRPARSRPDVTIVPMMGVLSYQMDELESNSLVKVMARLYRTEQYYCLPVPAIVRDKQHKEIVLQLPVVQKVIERMQAANYVVTSLAAPNAEHSTLVSRGLLEAEDVEQMSGRDAVGEIAALWFDRLGCPIVDESIQPIGLGLQDLQRIVTQRLPGTVLAIVAADVDRIDPLLAAIQGRIINVLVTDHVTAEELLRRAG